MSGRRRATSTTTATSTGNGGESKEASSGTAGSGRCYTAEEMAARVAALLVEMRLAKCADTQCGGTDPLYTAVRCGVDRVPMPAWMSVGAD